MPIANNKLATLRWSLALGASRPKNASSKVHIPRRSTLGNTSVVSICESYEALPRILEIPL